MTNPEFLDRLYLIYEKFICKAVLFVIISKTPLTLALSHQGRGCRFPLPRWEGPPAVRRAGIEGRV
jgi:hypothetical protein